MSGRKAMQDVPLPCSLWWVQNRSLLMEGVIKISVDADEREVLRLYGYDVFNKLRAKRLRLVLHPEEEPYIIVKSNNQNK